MTVEIIPGWERPDDVRALFAEYTALLVRGDPAFAGYLELQRYDDELKNLRRKYGPPAGRLYAAYVDGAPAGCAALKPIDGASCELKRLYVRPAYRGNRLGRLLVERILEDARTIGYAAVYLDTLPFLRDAIRLYWQCGFRDVPKWNDSPMEAALYMKLDLKDI